jgi:hypothetical protein
MTKRYGLLVSALTGFLAPGAAPAFADVILTLIPASGSVAGLPGSTVGWGYTVTNTTAEWIQTMSLNSDAFQMGSPNLIFDFPAVGPSSSVTLDFDMTGTASCALPPCGLYELTWDNTAPLGFTNSGTFTLSSDFYSAEPGTPGAMDLGSAPDASAAYSATVSSPSAVPEPSALSLLVSALACGAAVRFGRRVRASRRFAGPGKSG